VSFGKENGTGLGLTVVQKIVQDHGGKVLMERSPDARTVFRITIPGQDQRGDPQGSPDVDNKPVARRRSPVADARATENSIRHSDT
jgi:hypothetical protein